MRFLLQSWSSRDWTLSTRLWPDMFFISVFDNSDFLCDKRWVATCAVKAVRVSGALWLENGLGLFIPFAWSWQLSKLERSAKTVISQSGLAGGDRPSLLLGALFSASSASLSGSLLVQNAGLISPDDASHEDKEPMPDESHLLRLLDFRANCMSSTVKPGPPLMRRGTTNLLHGFVQSWELENIWKFAGSGCKNFSIWKRVCKKFFIKSLTTTSYTKRLCRMDCTKNTAVGN